MICVGEKASMAMDEEMLDLLAYELGEIYLWEKQCPGVYYLSIHDIAGGFLEWLCQ